MYSYSYHMLVAIQNICSYAQHVTYKDEAFNHIICMFQESVGATPTSSTRQRAACWGETARQTRKQCFDKEEVPAGAFSECCTTSSNSVQHLVHVCYGAGVGGVRRLVLRGPGLRLRRQAAQRHWRRVNTGLSINTVQQFKSRTY